MVRTVTLEDVRESVGKEVGVSNWLLVTQDMINQFADATNDHQWIHIDEQRAKDTPFGGTIAHGFLTLSLLSTLAYQALPALEGATMGINYGFDKVRLMNPVKTGSKIRGRFTLKEADIRPSGRVIFNYEATIEIENIKKPALVANWIIISLVPPPEE